MGGCPLPNTRTHVGQGREVAMLVVTRTSTGDKIPGAV
jgi:hypothetical protein